MTISRTYSTHRCPWHDYSKPGWYYLAYETRNSIKYFGDAVKLGDDQAACRLIVNDAIAMLPERYPEIRLDTARVWPSSVHLLVQVLKHRYPARCGNFKTYEEWWIHRRTMTIPLISGFFETHSSQAINLQYGSPGQCVWKNRYGDRILEDMDAVSLVREILSGDPDGRVVAMMWGQSRVSSVVSEPITLLQALNSVVRTTRWIRPFVLDTANLERYAKPRV